MWSTSAEFDKCFNLHILPQFPRKYVIYDSTSCHSISCIHGDVTSIYGANF